MGGRITAISAYDADPTTYFVGTAGGGLLKTLNAGTTFDSVFDHEGSSSVGSVCVAPSDPNIVWVGTGEANPRNSVSFGDGVYKSTDGGKTWKNMGLGGTFQIGKVLISPKDPNTVFVAALGRLWGPNKERGVFRTTDGGATWKHVLAIDDKTGAVDLVMSPTDPNNLIVATWDRLRDGFDSHRGDHPVADGYDAYDPIRKYGAGSGLYKTTNNGDTWKKLSQGLPANNIGRIGLDVYRKNPKVVFAIIDCEKIGMGPTPSRVYIGIDGEDATGGVKLTNVTSDAPADKAGLKVDDLVTAVEGKPVTSYDKFLELIRAHKAGEAMNLTIQRGGKPQSIKVTVQNRPQEAQPQLPRSLPMMLGAFGSDAEGGGVALNRVFEEGAASVAGMADGDVIVKVEGKAVANAQALLDALRDKKPGDKVKVAFKRDGKEKVVDLKVQEPMSFGGGGGSSRTRPFGGNMSGQRENVQEDQGTGGHEYGGVYRSDDFGETWKRVNSLNPRPMYFSVIRVDPTDERYLYVLGISMYRSSDGGKTFRGDGANRVHPDQHDLWIDPRDGRHMVVGCDGGFYVTYDRMDHWDFLNGAAVGQFYHVSVDNSRPYRVIGGLQDNGVWMGPSMSLSGAGPMNEDWYVVGGGDGFHTAIDPTDPDVVYYESQDGAMQRRNLRTGQTASLRPRPQQGQRFRFNWNTPFILSSHNPRIFYAAGNYLFRSVKQGDDMRAISPEISRTGAGTGTAISESPRNSDVLWVGTDDGNLWVTRDGGQKWTNVESKVGLKGPRWVATIEASRFVEGRAYVAFDGHRSDEDDPLVYVTEDFGETWKTIRSNLPAGSSRCLREDLKNPDLLYVGTEFATFASIDRGESWTKLNSNLPTVAVYDLAQHPTTGDLLAATHGRSIWVLNVTALRQLTPAAMAEDAHLYEPAPVVRWRTEPQHGSPYGAGHRKFFGENPPRGTQIVYSLAKPATNAKITIYDVSGAVVRELPASGEAGLHSVAWELGRAGGGARGGAGGGGGAAGAGAGGGQGRTGRGGTGGSGGGNQELGPVDFGGFGFGRPIAAGAYRVVLNVDGKEYTTVVRVENDPTLGPDQLDRLTPAPTGERD